MAIKACLFDLDGVVVFTDKYHYLAWKQLSDEKGWKFNETLNHRLRGVARMDSLQIILDHNHVDLPEPEKIRLADIKNGYYVKLLEKINEGDMYPGAVNFIKAIRAKGIKTALCSSSKNGMMVLEALGLKGLFDTVITGHDIKKSKPDPEIFLLAASRLKMAPAECVVFEDAESGVEAALAAKMGCCGVGEAAMLPKAPQTIKDYAVIDVDALIQTGENKALMPPHDMWLRGEPKRKGQEPAKKGDFRRFLRYLEGYRLQIDISVLLILLTTVLTLTYPYIFKLLIDKAIPHKDWALAKFLMLLFTVFFLARGALAYLNRFLLQRLGMRVTVDMRKDCFVHLQTLSLKYYDKQQTGQIVSRVTEDTGALHGMITGVLVNFITDSVTLLAVILTLLLIQWQLALATFAVLPFFLLNYNFHKRLLRKLSRRHRRNWHRAVGFLTERVSSTRLVKSFAQEEREINRFSGAMERDFKNFNAVTLYNARLWVISDMIASFGGLAVLLFGGWLCIQGQMSVGELVMFNIYIGFLFSPIVRLSDMNTTIERALTALEKIYEIMDTPSFVSDAPDAMDLPPIKGRVEFKDVQFSYNAGRKVLKDINLRVEPGQMAALVGPSGAGKTTLINLLCRFYDVDQGAILLDGFDIRRVRIKSLRRQIGVVMQENLMFSGPLLDNIRYGMPEASLEQIMAAAKAANAHEFIQDLPQGYHSAVGERGVKISGGQRQRVAIARALLTNPRILIFDEATSALDTESERLIQDAMERFMKDRTTFVIAHRLSTILRADRIFVFQDGSIVEEGTHHDLVRRQGLYQKLYEMQFKESGGPAGA